MSPAPKINGRVINSETLSEFDINEHLSPGVYLKEGFWHVIFHAPHNALDVQIVGDFTRWDCDAVTLKPTPNGKFWYLKVKQDSQGFRPADGDFYKFRVRYSSSDDWFYFQDPAARCIESTSLSGKSIVYDSKSYQWHETLWERPDWEYYLIYQLHALRFTSRNPHLAPLQRIQEEIPYIKNTGVTAIQLLPLNAFSGSVSWGYNGTFFYAIETSYGSPNDLKALVDTAHQHGLAVILDIVLNHIGNADNILWQIDKEEYVSGDTEWGPMLNFGSDVARHFLIQYLLYFAQEFHIDGFRFDMSHILHKGNTWTAYVRQPGKYSGWSFIKELRYKLKQIDPKILLIAEELPNNWHVTKSHVNSSWCEDDHGPFDSQWCDDFHDNCKAVIAGDHLDKLKKALTYFGDNWHEALIYTESHDEVGNTNSRIAKIGRDGMGWNMSQLAAPLTILARGIPMIFMGQEGGEWMQFGQAGEPAEGGSWWDHRLNLEAYETSTYQQKILAWYRAIMAIRKNDMRSFSQGNIILHHIHDQNGIVAFSRGNEKYLIILNFRGSTWWNYSIGVSGRYKEIANTSWPPFNISGFTEATRHGDHYNQIVDVHIPAYGALILERY